MSKKSIFLSIIFALSFSSYSYALSLGDVLGVGETDEVIKREENNDSFFGLSKEDAVKVEGAEALAGVSNVVIASFKVGFIESAKQVNKAKGSFLSGATFGGKARGNMTLEGVSAEVKQKIADQAYADFVSQLTAKGYTVLDRTDFAGSSDYSAMNVKNFPYEVDISGMLSKYGKTMFYQPSELGTTGVPFANDLESNTGIGASLKMAAAFSSDAKVAAYAEKNHIGVISATYVVDFAAAGGHEGISSASIKIGQNLAVTRASVKMIVSNSSTFKSGLSNIYLGQSIQSGEKFGEVVNTTSDVDAVVQEVANVASLVVGQGTNRSRDFTIKADPQKYETLSIGVLKQTNATLLEKQKFE